MYCRTYQSTMLCSVGLIAIALFCGKCTALEPTDNNSPGSKSSSSTGELLREVRGLLSSRCFLCHGPDANSREGGFRLDQPESYLSAADSGEVPVVPGDLSSSAVWERITTDDPASRMPPPQHGESLTKEEAATVRRWIEQGARMPTHWSFVAPVRPMPPAHPGNLPVFLHNWQQPIDRFVLQQQLLRGFQPSPEASRPELLRRVSIDLIGLPPTLEEIIEFEKDIQPLAFERQVDRLLASPSFGEHWARQWLDLARYADSAGYADDPERTIWAYRDWVIRAFNANMPLDQFTIEQIAGDLLDAPTVDQLTATAFHRNTLTNSEGGTNDEEFRNVAVVDRVNTTMAVWMGLTFNCAQCHNHKYDPFTQEDYFQLFAVFNQSQDADRRDESPTLKLYSEDQMRQMSEWRSNLCRDEMLFHQVQAIAAEMIQWPSGATGMISRGFVAIDSPADANSNPLKEFTKRGEGVSVDFLAAIDVGWLFEPIESIRWRASRLRKKLDTFPPYTTVPIMSQLAEIQRRTTRVHLRGDYRAQGDEVRPATPKALHAAPSGGEDHQPTRLEIAKWLVDRNNPLTARVWVNRLWESLFGTGLVRTSEEFGAQGDAPSHPELLDWLACELRQLDWDFKAMLRVIVLSQTYRQTSQVTRELLEADGNNIWLARGPRVRLTAEMIRDVALKSAGLMSLTMYGPPVLPPQPNLGLRAAFGSETDWKTSQGEDRFRRAIYTKWRRSNPYPSMGTFDAPSREVCVLRRDVTNTPLQALVTLNDPVFVEAAQGLSRILAVYERSSANDKEVIAKAWRLCTSREPTTKELDAMTSLLHESRKHFSQNPSQATQFATEPLGPLPENFDSAELAAWTAVCNVLLNLDEVLMKR